MTKIIGISFIASCLFIGACGNSQATKNESKEGSTPSKNNEAAAMNDKANTEKSYLVNLVNNKKDPSCGMPVTAGIGDTLHYNKYVLGFCSEGCKEDTKQALLKNPKAVLDAAMVSLPTGTIGK
jgi:protein involved in sex pheromone biosynthesis